MAFNPNLCAGCPLDGMYRPLEARGSPTARFMIVTDVPSQAAGKQDRLLTKHQMELLGSKLSREGFQQEDFAFTPACHCPYDPDGHVTKVKTAAHKHCRQHLLAEIESSDFEAIIPLGATAASQVFGRATKITKVHGIVTQSEELGVPIFPLMSPGLVVMYPQNEPVFDADIASFARAVNADYDIALAASQQIGEYEIVEDLQFLIDMDPEIISFDTENTGLRWYQSGVNVRTYNPAIHKGKSIFRPKFQILTMQFSVEPGKGYMLVWDHPERPIDERSKPRLRNQLRKLLCDEKRIVIGQNDKYDNTALWMAEGIRYRIGGDTLMLATLVDENLPEKNLDILTKIYVPEMGGYADVFNATYDKSRMWEVPLSALVGYGCGDTDASLRVYHKLEEIVSEDAMQWAHYCRVTIPGLNAFAGMETRGMFIDEGSALADFKEMMTADVARMEQECLAAIPRNCRQAIAREFLQKTNDKGQLVNKGKTVEEALSFTRTDFLKQVLFTHPLGFRLKPQVFTKTTAKLKDVKLREPSTSAKDHLPYFFDTCPFTMQLAEYQKDRHLLNTNVVKFEENYIRDGKVRPNYHLHKAVTGRSSSDDPNGQNYPKRGARAMVYRKMFIAPPDGYIPSPGFFMADGGLVGPASDDDEWFAIEADLSQAELRIAASMSGDKTMIEIYRKAGDIHKATALIVAGITLEAFEKLPKKEQKELRQKAKAVNFGFLYGMGWRKFIGYAKTQYAVEFTEKEAQRIRQGFFQKYKALERWHNVMRNFAKEHKFVRSYTGRIRHLPMIDSPEEYIQQEAGRQAINSPVQETGSSLGVMALGRINDEIDPNYMQVVGFIHDAIVVYVRKKHLTWGMRTLKHYMQTNPLKEWFGTEIKVPIIADVGFGLNLGEIHECEGFSLDKPFDYTSLKDKDGELLIRVPPQKIPPNNGRLRRSAYTTPDDVEAEDVEVRSVRHRMIRAQINPDTVKRVQRSRKQMIINRRNQAIKKESEKAVRAAPLRRTRPVSRV